jgi:phage gp29-like protein
MTIGDTPSISMERIERSLAMRYAPIPELTMALLTQQLNQFRTGTLAPAARTWEVMIERDLELSTPAEKRFGDVARQDWEIYRSEDSAEAEAHADALKYFYDNLTATAALEQDEVGGFDRLLRQMQTAHAHRYSIHEMVLRVDDASKRKVTATFFHFPVWLFEARKGRVAYLRNEGDFDGTPLKPGEWLVTVGAGLMRGCSIAYACKWFPLADWMLFCRRFGIPGIHGETDAAPNTKPWNDFVQALQEFANDWVSVTNRGTKINLIEAAKGGGGSLPFEPLIERVDRAYAKAFRGGDLSTGSRSGDSVGASLQNEEKNVFLESDCALITGTLNARVDRPIIRYLFGTEPKAFIRINPPKRLQVDQDLKSAEFLLRAGCRISKETAMYRLNWPEADEDETDLLQLPGGGAAAATPQPGDPAADPALANAKDTFAEAARRQLGAAVQADLAPLLKRLAAIEKIRDEDVRRARLEALLSEFDSLERDILADPEAATVLARINGAAVAEGLATPLAVENSRVYHRDHLGRFAADGGPLSPADNIERGTKAAEYVMRNKTDVPNAMNVRGLGQVGFVWGTPGDASNGFKGGKGFSHIIAKHKERAAKELPRTLALGSVRPHQDPVKRYVVHKSWLAIVVKDKQASSWAVTHYEPTNKDMVDG